MTHLRRVICILIAFLSNTAGLSGQERRDQRNEEVQSCSESAPESFVTWAREHATPLGSTDPGGGSQELLPLRKIIGDARVVGLGESTRRVHEFYSVRARVFRFLVEEMGFTALAMETGFAEADRVNDYLLGRIDEPKHWQDWFTFGFGDETELQALLRWMRQFNLEPRHTRKIHFYGVDSMVVYSSPETAVGKAFEYVDRVDDGFLQSRLRADLAALTGEMRGSGSSRRDMEISIRKYVKLPEEKRNLYTARVADLLSQMEAHRLDYVSASSEEAYQWGYQFAVAAKQLDTLYREAAATVKPGKDLDSGDIPGAIFASRDRAMFDNLVWALGREGASGRIAVWAHNAHVSKGSVRDGSGGLAGAFAAGPRLGMFLDAAFGSEYVSIGTAFYEGQPGWQQILGPARCGTIDRELNRTGLPLFLLDISSAAGAEGPGDWFSAPRMIRADIPQADYRAHFPGAWNAVIFVRRISPVQAAAQ